MVLRVDLLNPLSVEAAGSELSSTSSNSRTGLAEGPVDFLERARTLVSAVNTSWQNKDLNNIKSLKKTHNSSPLDAVDQWQYHPEPLEHNRN